MKLHIISDIHLEFGKLSRAYDPPECDAVILAGDIATGVVGVMWAAETFKVPVIMVPGNHEFYGKRIHAEHIEKMREKARGSSVMVADNAVIEIAGVVFLCATLWADFDLYGNAPLAMQVAAQKSNDYRQIRSADRVLLRPEDTQAMCQESKFFLSEALRRPAAGKTVVVTHFAPSEMSSLPQYRGDLLTPAYASRLEDLILDTQPALWVHGHMHNSSDYRIGETRVICNPRGYYGYELNPEFDPGLVIEI